MADMVWISTFRMDPSRSKWLTGDRLPGDGEYPASFQGRDERGEALGPECFPKVLWTQPAANGNYKAFPPLFGAGPGVVVTGKCPDVLRRFDLGAGHLHPVDILKLDRATPYDGDFFFLNIGNRKDAFLADEAPRLRRMGDGLGLPFTLKDEEIAVSPAALDGPDIWVDVSVRHAFFVSAALGQALIAARVATPFRRGNAG